ncbi:NAD(P)-dependent oxidoreductase [Actinokineospora iranica]|uniref:NAD(P)-binding domain-containing protein n=1 Tax=Actinokineospora iranica TaxID=1271860 RepID=A0A1G6MYD7_9PSEU|nr:NAD(P)H-binding protein [Actinokineospora iranica]SDC60562.1 hypothetical protein SAMN05216174_10397 [Actinokineospora iranica]
MSRIALFGSAGRAGRAIAAEAAGRGHQVTSIHRDTTSGDVTDADQVAAAAAGHDVAVSSVYDAAADHAVFYPAASRALLDGLDRAGVGRLVHIGLSVLLETAPGVRVVDGPDFPPEYLPFCLAHAAGADVLRAATTGPEWVIMSPAGDFDREAGRAGRYRLTGGPAEELISYPDFAIAVLDEIEGREHSRVHLGVAGV